MGSHGDKGSSSADVVVEHILELDEGVVPVLGEINVSEDCGHYDWSDFCSAFIDCYSQGVFDLSQFYLGTILLIQKAPECKREPLQRQQVIPISSDLNLVHRLSLLRFIKSIHHLFGIRGFKLHAVVKAQLLKLLVRYMLTLLTELLSQTLLYLSLCDQHVRHL